MSQKLSNIKISLDESLEDLLKRKVPTYSSHRILKKSIDARKRHDLKEVYSVEVFEQGEEIPEDSPILENKKWSGPKPLIVGSGPAGLFAAIRFVERGIPCIMIERGSACQQRMLKINQFWRYGDLDTENNVCYGEGGAGLYSDGKLITRIKSPYIFYVLDRLVKFGAPEEIKYLSNPHVGSDKIRRVIPKVREFLLENGCEIHFDTKMEKLLVENNKVKGIETKDGRKFHSDHVILATGHSANDLFEHLDDIGVFMEGKSFALGLRVEHPQSRINKIQYRQHSDHPKLGSANYKLTYHDYESNTGIYSFCMCPGGYVLSSGTEANGIVCNGMSNYRRNSPFANSAIVVTIDHEKNFADDKFGGLKFRSQIEQKAFQYVKAKGGSKELPAQSIIDFLEGKVGDTIKGSCPSGTVASDLNQILPEFVAENLKEGFSQFEQKMKGFLAHDVQIYGVESRTSCPLRITRDKDSLQSVSHSGLYPTGEGAGYAGGITSAAVDGIKVVEQIINDFC